jgi:hypothetical protein
MTTDQVSHTFTFRPTRGRNGRPRPPPLPADLPQGNVPRIARLMALAHHFESLRQQGTVADYADLARLGGVTRARITQIMSLLNLAPDIQEEILFLPRTTQGRDRISTRSVLPIAQIIDWKMQRREWERLQRLVKYESYTWVK